MVVGGKDKRGRKKEKEGTSKFNEIFMKWVQQIELIKLVDFLQWLHADLPQFACMSLYLLRFYISWNLYLN